VTRGNARAGAPTWRWLVLVGLFGTGACGLPRWPVDAPLTSDFGVRLRGWRPDIHRGVDLDVPSGTEVRAMAGARVRFAGVMRGFGNVVWLDHGLGVLTVYAHLSTIGVREGGSVRAGQVIGLSGATGDVTSPHLHFEVWQWGREVDPIPLLGGRP
jgi:murein DD-endopeptidase MepM/ murein hydrolase activator NlpD